jgi:peptidoglycan LD-endopeptidase LytH
MYPEKKLSWLLSKQTSFAPVVSLNLNHGSVLVLDLSERNKDLQDKNLADTAAFSAYVFGLIANAGAVAAVGGYNENRIIYSRSKHFAGSENRTVHLGIDIWAAAGTRIHSPLAGKIHSFRNNRGFGDYGPTVVIEHNLEGITFYTLYGHLSVDDLAGLSRQQEIARGQLIGRIGNYPENGDWPPHLHFQVIADMQGYDGDFPGVSTKSTAPYYLRLCPDPNLILRIAALMN